MIKLSDYIIQFLVEHGVKDIFLASGGGIMHLLDSIGRNPRIQYYCNYHEQASAVAAEGYARMTGRIGACMGTTGPGAVNLLSGVVASWVDSVPLLAISGQVRSDLIADYSHVRQVGPQEGNAVAMSKPVTKYSASIREPRCIRYHMERALYEATTGRPGPVWIEVPVDIQGVQVDEQELSAFRAPEPAEAHTSDVASAARAILDGLEAAKRPVIIPGNGIHYSGSRELLRRFVEQVNVPVLLPFTSKDLFEEDHPLQFGVFGGTGQRRANFAVQNCDYLLALAAGLNVQKIGFNIAGFAPKARKVVIDIDAGQLTHQMLKPSLGIQLEIHGLLTELLSQLQDRKLNVKARWLDACNRWKQRYPIMTEDYYKDINHVNTYMFMDRLSDKLAPEDAVVTGNGIDVVSYYQAFRTKIGQRTITTGWGSMGWDLPNAIGACIGNNKRPTICVTGDGSLQWNIQEMLTARHYDLPIKLFVFNNRGYTCIRSTQANLFEGRFVGADRRSGVSNPDFRLMAEAYGWNYLALAKPQEISEKIDTALRLSGPTLCEVNVAAEQGVSPKASAFRREDGTLDSRPLEDMAPFLPREEVYENMHQFDDEGGAT